MRVHGKVDEDKLAQLAAGVTVSGIRYGPILARLDRVPIAREIAQLGAVLGREFTYEMLQALATVEEPVLLEGLRRLVEHELLYQRGRPPRSKYIFKHALAQEATYESILKARRRACASNDMVDQA